MVVHLLIVMSYHGNSGILGSQREPASLLVARTCNTVLSSHMPSDKLPELHPRAGPKPQRNLEPGSVHPTSRHEPMGLKGRLYCWFRGVPWQCRVYAKAAPLRTC